MEDLVPISPKEVIARRGNEKCTIPLELLRILNLMIVERWDGEQAIISIADITKRGFTFTYSHYQGVRNAFTPLGWKIEYVTIEMIRSHEYDSQRLGERIIFSERK